MDQRRETVTESCTVASRRLGIATRTVTLLTVLAAATLRHAQAGKPSLDFSRSFKCWFEEVWQCIGPLLNGSRSYAGGSGPATDCSFGYVVRLGSSVICQI